MTLHAFNNLFRNLKDLCMICTELTFRFYYEICYAISSWKYRQFCMNGQNICFQKNTRHLRERHFQSSTVQELRESLVAHAASRNPKWLFCQHSGSKVIICKPIPANTTHWNNNVLMLAQRLRRWPNIKTSLFQRFVLAGYIALWSQ